MMTLNELQLQELREVSDALRIGACTPKMIRKARKSMGMTQRELADAIGYRIESICRFENGSEEIPRSVALAVLALVFVCAMDIIGDAQGTGSEKVTA